MLSISRNITKGHCYNTHIYYSIDIYVIVKIVK